MTFSGVLTALVTPFRGGQVDQTTFRQLVQRQLAAGIDGLVPCGTTGEAPTLNLDEHAEVIRWTVEEAGGQVPVLAGVGSNCTRTAIENSRRAKEAGADGLLVTAPYYNKPTQEGLFRHFVAVAESQPDLEICVYDVPGRTGVRVLPATIERLSQVDNITCVKDATGDLAHAGDVFNRVGERLGLLSGDDFTTVAHVAAGGVGCISVASNLIPERMVAMVAAARGGRIGVARDESAALQPLFQALFVQSNPLPIKAAMARSALLVEEYRLPLCPMDEGPRSDLFQVLETLGL